VATSEAPDPRKTPQPCVVWDLRSILVLSQSASSSVKLHGARPWHHKVWFKAFLAANVITTAQGRGINVRTLTQALIANCQSAIGNVLTVALELY